MACLLPPVKKIIAQRDEALSQLRDNIELAIRLHVTPDDVVFDVGANRGFYAATFAEIAKQVVAFEPNPRVFGMLRQNVGAPNVTFVNKAVADREGELEFFLDVRPDSNGIGSSLAYIAELQDSGMTEKVTVQATTVDSYCRESGIVPTFIKVDVEGCEPLVFAGAHETLERHRPKLIFEFWESHWDKGFAELFQSLEPFYYLRRVQDGSDASRYYRENRAEGGADILCLPRVFDAHRR
jgi:FkbM family methyltransferase